MQVGREFCDKKDEKKIVAIAALLLFSEAVRTKF
jgi:hypothetical protein